MPCFMWSSDTNPWSSFLLFPHCVFVLWLLSIHYSFVWHPLFQPDCLRLASHGVGGAERRRRKWGRRERLWMGLQCLTSSYFLSFPLRLVCAHCACACVCLCAWKRCDASISARWWNWRRSTRAVVEPLRGIQGTTRQLFKTKRFPISSVTFPWNGSKRWNLSVPRCLDFMWWFPALFYGKMAKNWLKLRRVKTLQLKSTLCSRSVLCFCYNRQSCNAGDSD